MDGDERTGEHRWDETDSDHRRCGRDASGRDALPVRATDCARLGCDNIRDERQIDVRSDRSRGLAAVQCRGIIPRTRLHYRFQWPYASSTADAAVEHCATVRRVCIANSAVRCACSLRTPRNLGGFWKRNRYSRLRLVANYGESDPTSSFSTHPRSEQPWKPSIIPNVRVYQRQILVSASLDPCPSPRAAIRVHPRESTAALALFFAAMK